MDQLSFLQVMQRNDVRAAQDVCFVFQCSCHHEDRMPSGCHRDGVMLSPRHGFSSGRPAPLSDPPPASPGLTGSWSGHPGPCAVRQCPPPLTYAPPAHSQTCQQRSTEGHVPAPAQMMLPPTKKQTKRRSGRNQLHQLALLISTPPRLRMCTHCRREQLNKCVTSC